jgi:hypothetical protein
MLKGHTMDAKTKEPAGAAAIADDMLIGAAAMAQHIGNTQRQVEHLLATQRLPAFKLGGIWRMRKSTYQGFIDRLEAAALKAIEKREAADVAPKPAIRAAASRHRSRRSGRQVEAA